MMNKNHKEIILAINKKFKKNFDCWEKITDHNLEKTFIGLQCIAAIGEVLRSNNASKHHDICCQVYDEIFSDGISAIYLAANAMDKPAHIILRRIIELGVVAVYLWDMPHMAYSWNDYDQDLSFSTMLKHVNSKGYLSYVNEENSSDLRADLFHTATAQKIYGILSDVVHGKISTFESLIPERFQFNEHDWYDFVNLAEEIVCMLVRAFLLRFSIAEEIFKIIPTAKKMELDL